MPFKKYRLLIEILFLWVLPFASLWVLQIEFTKQFSASMGLFMLLFPAFTMYLVVGTGAGYCKFWYFTTSYSISGVTPTIGLIYSAVINLSVYFFIDLLKEPSWLFMPLVGIGTAIYAIFIDIFLLGSGLFYLKSKQHPLGSNPVKHAFSYGSWFFTVVGIWNALGIFFAYSLWMDISVSVWVLLGIMPLLFALPFMIYFIRKRNTIKRLNLVHGE
jgi:hypothetical protein